jgi:hypothetical protein
VIALAEEMNGPMTIGEISWQRGGSSGSPQGTYSNFKLFMGVSANSELTDTFADNYLPGTRTLVYDTSSQIMSAQPDGWVTIALDTPFEYNGTDNLIVELEWSGGANMFYTYMWETGSSRGLMNKSNLGSPTGTLYTRMSQLMLTPASSLEQYTFAGIKSLW